VLETLLKDICRKVPYSFPCGSDDVSELKSTPTHLSFQVGKEKDSRGVRLGEYEGLWQTSDLLYFQFVFDKHSDVQGHCRVVAASSSYAKVQYAYNELNCTDGRGTPCSGACLRSLILG
jgi:hypothetical protein